MSVKDRLDGFRTRFAGCKAVAFADLSTGMVLSSSTREKTTQEHLDALCQKATVSLNGDDATRVAAAFSTSRCMPQTAVLFDRTQQYCFVRSAHDNKEALCILCDSDAPVTDIMAAAVQVLDAIGMEV
ncbi:hypothetical protein KX928_20060 [Roseobacter sp. YSTF-M11]|uniref:Uncharacterized protein n=1 Tax=Roseobacter insulae TaxID=2859783 RepID=A0A9X1K041_9RHOB|nr:hypothetical protein [Roseobacter insulae]MBW4710086.1 hypothetical protein [Roseobacter insulae]